MYTIVPEVVEVLTNVLKSTYGSLPQNDDWKFIAQEFLQFRNLPNCIGALDGRHFKIDHSSHSASLNYNKKKFFSIM